MSTIPSTKKKTTDYDFHQPTIKSKNFINASFNITNRPFPLQSTSLENFEWKTVPIDQPLFLSPSPPLIFSHVLPAPKIDLIARSTFATFSSPRSPHARRVARAATAEAHTNRRASRDRTNRVYRLHKGEKIRRTYCSTPTRVTLCGSCSTYIYIYTYSTYRLSGRACSRICAM